jgi:hypothetical protein
MTKAQTDREDMPMSEKRAYEVASKRAKRDRREWFVVWSIEDHDPPGQHYHVSDDFDLETYYLGAEVVACVEPS